MASRDDVTRLLADLRSNHGEASEELLVLVYEELRQLARYYMSQERSNHTLQTTALVHEAYIRLMGEEDTAWESRVHYFRVAARAMRRVLIDHARSKSRKKKGAGWNRETLDNAVVTIGMPLEDLLSLDNALDRLAEMDPSLAQVIELRFFGGLTIEDTARVLDVSPWKVKNDWRIARAWLKKEL
ncbi:MAG: sigma-70 family RNA polymerase sigma factor [Planctomycetota bacterium]